MCLSNLCSSVGRIITERDESARKLKTGLGEEKQGAGICESEMPLVVLPAASHPITLPVVVYPVWRMMIGR
jgi:hypothetical protein